MEIWVSYAGSLKLRASIIVPRERSADWYREDIEVPKGVIGMASALLRRMSLPGDVEHVVFGKLRESVSL